jgi:hypothetical protein
MKYDKKSANVVPINIDLIFIRLKTLSNILIEYEK